VFSTIAIQTELDPNCNTNKEEKVRKLPIGTKFIIQSILVCG
jgi:hypothetical protein